MATQDIIYGNRYGFFKPAIERIRKALDSNVNVVANVEKTKTEWQMILGHQYRVSALFFAPRDPSEAIRRTQLRAQKGGIEISDEELRIRAESNSQNIIRIFSFDYWVDTSEFEEIMPAVRAAIEIESKGTQVGNPKLIRVSEAREEVSELAKNYMNFNFSQRS